MNFADNLQSFERRVHGRCAEVSRNGWRPNVIILNPFTWGQLSAHFESDPKNLTDPHKKTIRGLKVLTSDTQPMDTFKLAEVRTL